MSRHGNRRVRHTVVGLVSAMLIVVSPAFANDEFLGAWTLETNVGGTDYPANLTIAKEGDAVTVKVEDDLNGDMATSNVKIEGNVLTFDIEVAALQPDPLKVTLTLADGALTGGLAGEAEEYPMKAARAAAAEASSSDGSPAGDWEIFVDVAGDEYPARVTVTETDGNLGITVEDDMNGNMPISDIVRSGNEVTCNIEVAALGAAPLPITFTFNGDTLEGTLDAGPDMGQFPIRGQRAAKSGGIEGAWDVVADVAGDEYPVVMTVTPNGDAFEVTMEDDLNGVMPVTDVTFDGSVLSFNVKVDALGPDPIPVKMNIEGEELSGTLDGGASGVGEIVLRGKKAGGDSDDANEKIMASLQSFKDGMENKDAAKIGTALADDFEHPEFGNKESMLTFLETTFSSGELDNAEIDVSAVEIQVDGDEATASPGELVAAFGTATIHFTFKKQEDGEWRLKTVEVEGI